MKDMYDKEKLELELEKLTIGIAKLKEQLRVTEKRVESIKEQIIAMHGGTAVIRGLIVNLEKAKVPVKKKKEVK